MLTVQKDTRYDNGGDGESFVDSLGSTQSLTSSIFNYRKVRLSPLRNPQIPTLTFDQENGRTYSNFKDTEYWYETLGVRDNVGTGLMSTGNRMMISKTMGSTCSTS
jgi:hypothetical protein